MLSSKPVIFFHLALLLAILSAACQRSQTDNPNVNRAPEITENSPPSAPFATKEPDSYQADLIVSVTAGGENSRSKTFVAKSADRQITTFFSSAATERSLLRIGGKTFLLDHETRRYAENASTRLLTSDTLSEEQTETQNFLSTSFLNERADAVFEKLETDNNLTKYRVSLGAEKAASEVLVYFDENLQIPVRQEFYQERDGVKSLVYQFEVANFKTPADEIFFEIPPDYKQVSLAEFYRKPQTGRE